MSLGFSISDMISVTQLAWKLFKECRSAAYEYNELRQAIGSLRDHLPQLRNEILRDDLLSSPTSDSRAGNSTANFESSAGYSTANFEGSAGNAPVHSKALANQTDEIWNDLSWLEECMGHLSVTRRSESSSHKRLGI